MFGNRCPAVLFSIFFIFVTIVIACVHVCAHAPMSWYTHGSQRTAFGNQVSPPLTDSKIKLRLAQQVPVSTKSSCHLVDFFIFLCLSVFCLLVCFCTMCMQCPQRPEEDGRCPGTRDVLWVLGMESGSSGRAACSLLLSRSIASLVPYLSGV